MRHTRTLFTGSLIAAAVALALPLAAFAQDLKPAGIVTTLQGTATVRRVSTEQPAPQLLPLRFKDPVRLQDLIQTGDQSLARILLGGAAVVTVREHSSLTITESGGTSTIDITSGRIALAVAKEKMKPGDRIDVKTPNAVAGVRGMVLITEVTQVAGQPKTDLTLLTGLVDVFLRDQSGRLVGSPFTLNALQTLGVSGFTPPTGPRNITRLEAQTIANSYKARLHQPPTGANQHVSDRQVEQASNVAAAIGGGRGDSLNSYTPQSSGPPRLSGADIQNGSGHNPAIVPTPERKPPVEPCDCLTEGRIRPAARR